jgi:class 3 adenylate cyclase/tetratricopeptide (TPR) repeat protein
VKRKIAVILAADIAGYSRLIAEDEEETLRRFEGYRAVFAEFVERGSGRIFNTAGDAILAEFQSAVEAVRCAVDVQESLRARNLAYPPSRHMNFRIGITIGDVVERDNGDLLGDGVNIASRLESIAPPGGICVSRSVHEAVATKMTLQFADAGPQTLKNIPERIQAYTLTLDEDGVPQVTPPANTEKKTPISAKLPKVSMPPLPKPDWKAHGLTIALGALAIVVAGIYAYEYLPRGSEEVAETTAPQTTTQPSSSSQIATSDEPKPDDTTPPSAAPPASDPQPPASGQIETAAREPELRPDVVLKAPSPLASRYVLTRQWKDCDETGNTETALVACKGLLDTGGLSNDDQAIIRYKYARALRDSGDPDAAIENYNKSLEQKPSADAYNHRGVAYYDKGEYPRAIEDYNEALRMKPRDADALNNRAWTRYSAGDIDEALADANRAVTIDATKAYIFDTRGHIHEKRGAKNAAISDYRKALQLDKTTTTSSDGLTRLGATN